MGIDFKSQFELDLINESKLPFGALPFDKFNTEEYLPAVKQGLEAAKKRLDSLAALSDEPTFENTILALEDLSWELDQASNIYFNLFSAHADEKMQALAAEISGLISGFQSDLSLNENIFLRVKKLYDHKNTLDLDAESGRLLELSYKAFVRNGALLDPESKEKLRGIDQELSGLGPKFAENVLKSTNAFELWIDQSAVVEKMPEGVREAAAMEAEKKGKPGQWLFTLQAPSYQPFMTYCEDESLREKMNLAYATRGTDAELNNMPLIERIVALRLNRAQLLGFKTHADYVLEERMAEKSAKVTSFIERIVAAAKPVAQKDLAELEELKKQDKGAGATLRPWDTAFYSEKLRQKKYSLSEEELKPYFSLEKVIEGAFLHAKKLYDLEFVAKEELPVYHPEVKCYEVVNAKSKKHVGLFYADFFPRDTKKGGAWMTSFRPQGLQLGKMKSPQISIVCNFTKPTKTKPSLLTFDEVRTLFHEFGHALHGLLSNVRYASLSGTSVYWDFVELPSQIMENWLLEKEALDLFAAHYETAEKIPEELVKKIKNSAQFQAALMTVRQLNFASLDLAYHSLESIDELGDLAAFEDEKTKPYRLMEKVKGANFSCAFSHIFAGGYSAGYYSYKWAEVLEADAFELFKEKGIFNTEVSHAFRDQILSRGGSEHPMKLYVNFRGREPDPDALLRREGLIS